ncbi:MAG: ABC transporter permease, partial [Gemmatimonadota bacterium]
MIEFRRLARRLLRLFRRDHLEAEMDEEMRFHVELEAEELERTEGLDPKEARRRALVAFGGVEQTKERARQVRRVRWLEDLARDLRQGVRSMRRAPGFTVAAVLTLAVGIGATTAIFSVVNAVLLRPLPYDAPDRLVRVWESHPERSERNIVSPGNFMDWREQATVFEELAAHGNVFELGLTGGGEPVRVSATSITPAAFSVLGVQAVHGRVFPRVEDPGAGTTVLMAHGLWRSRYGGDPDIIGRTVMLNERAATVIGVLPPGFDFPSDQVDFWLPLRFGEADRQIRDS